jgi:hypothetical protein
MRMRIVVDDVYVLYQTYLARGTIIRQVPGSGSDMVELEVEDPDGNPLRFGSEDEPD